MRDEYISRINRVIDHIESHIDRPMSLEELADVAHFSRFHFHRIFKALVGETLHQFIQRIRVEKAAVRLIAQPKKSITEIALDCGFSGSAAFARAFRQAYGTSATRWRAQSKIRQTNGNPGQHPSNFREAYDVSSPYLDPDSNNQAWRIRMKEGKQLEAQVEVRDFPDMTVAYVRHIGPYKGDEALFKGLYEKLFKWAGARDLLNVPGTQVLSVYHDDPEITDESKLRTSVCITVPQETKVDGEIGKMVIPGGKYAAARFEIRSDEFGDAWNAVCGGWLPDSGYQPDDRPSFELSLNDPSTHPAGKFVVEICIPVKPL